MNRRFLSNILVTVLLVLSISGIVMYLTPFKKNIASMHTFFALLFILSITLHIINNKRVLGNYLLGKKQSLTKKMKGFLIIIILLLTTIGLYFNSPVLRVLYTFGNNIRNKQLGTEELSFDYQIIDLNKTKGKHKISIELKKGKNFKYPLFAIWTEDLQANYLETLYISKVISSSTFTYGKKTGNSWEAAIVRRPEALPYWSHKRGIKASDGLFVPLNNAPDLEAVSGATPTGNFIINSRSELYNQNSFRILIEINQSYDWNEYYSKEKFPDDLVYSGSGSVGQPSVIYEAVIDKDDLFSTYHKIMQLIGHGHHSGKDGKLYSDLTNITTAKNIAERIIVTVE